MNPWMIRQAESTRAWLMATVLTLQERACNRRPIRPLPLPAMARVWSHVGPDMFGPLSWPSYRWPLNGARHAMARLWPTRWDGQRHPLPQLMARAAWTGGAAAIGVAALVVASLLTFFACCLYLVANVIGAALIVFGGWIASGPTRPVVRHQSLEEWAADVDPDLIEGPVVGTAPPPSLTPESGSTLDGEHDQLGWNDRRDPLLRAQIDATRAQRELIAHQRELMAHEERMRLRRTAANQVGEPPSAQRTATNTPDLGRRRWLLVAFVKFALIVSVALGTMFFGGALLLSVLGGYVGVEPPTFPEIESGIHQRTAERLAEAQARASDAMEVDG